MVSFVTNPENQGNAKPKPMYKIHKGGDPVSIRNISVGTGTPDDRGTSPQNGQEH